MLARLSAWSRERKAEFLASRLEAGTSVLVVGIEGQAGFSTGNQVEKSLLGRHDVTAVVYEAPWKDIVQHFPSVVRADITKLPFATSSFDYVVSNAVLEHLGTGDRVAEAVEECDRVARRGAVHLVPNRWFPLEPHAKVPFLHWAPRRLHLSIFSRVSRGFVWSSSEYLLSTRDLRLAGGGARARVLWQTLGAGLVLETAPGASREDSH